MSPARARSSEKSTATAVVRLFAVSLAVLVMFSLSAITSLALTPCGTLAGSVSTWSAGTSSNWYTAGNWNPIGAPNSSGTSVCIADGSSTVTLDGGTNTSIDDLQLASGNTLTTGLNIDLFVFGTQMINNGSFLLNGGGGANAILFLDNNVTLSGAGTLTLTNAGSGGSAYIEQGVGGVTLTNQSTIQGTGIIGNGGLTLVNSGTINANVLNQGLYFNNSGGTTNTGLMEASNGGYLQFAGGIIQNGGGHITANSGSTVQFFGSVDVIGGTLTNNGGTLGTSNSAVAYLDGSTGAGAITINGTYTGDVNTDTFIYGSIINKGTIQLNGGGGTNALLLPSSSNVSLTGGGTVNMSVAGGGGLAYIEQGNGGVTLTNVDNTIQGAGIIGNGGLTLVNQKTINANSSGQALLINASGGVTNTSVLEASNGGILQLQGITVNNAGGGTITANSGSTVQIFGSTVIQGGTLTNNGTFFGTPTSNVAYLDGSTGAGAITINGTYTDDYNANTYVYGSIINHGTIQLNGGGGTNAILVPTSSNVTLTGGGTVNMSVAGGGGLAYIEQGAGGVTLTNVNNTIQGAGIIGNGGLTLVNQATINANSSGQALLINASGGVTNTSVLEASNGGNLQLQGIVVNNAGGGTITANSGSSVQIFGSTVIQGGSLTNNGSFLGTPLSQIALLDGSTGAGAVTINGTYTSDLNTYTYLLGSIVNNGTIQLNGGSGYNTFLFPESTNVTLTGGGTVNMSVAAGGGLSYIAQGVGGVTLTNVNNTIQGAGVIGNGGLTLVNQATINANSSGQTLALTASGGVTNTALIEASNGGTLQIAGITVNNAGGNITANAGSNVQIFGNAQIQGGTLTNNGSFFGTPVGQIAYLDGSTGAGAVTINGTYTTDLNSYTYLMGTTNNQGNILVNGGSGYNTYLWAYSSNTKLTGGGTVTLVTNGGGGSAYLSQAVGGVTLENFDNTIQGAGVIGNGGLSILNDVGGTFLANAPGQALVINASGTITNNGTFQANPNSILVVQSGPFTNFAGNTLTGGTYNVYGPSTMQIYQLGSGGGEIVNNAATILLDSPGSNLFDSTSNDALSNFSNNTAAGSFTIQNGRNFTSPASFSNAGAVNVGSGSTFTTGGAGNYNQSGGSTQLNGTLTAGGGSANFNGGVLYGNGGIVNGNVTMAGTIAPAATINGSNVPLTAGGLSINGNYTQTSAGIFNLGLGGLAPGSQFGFLGVSGNALIDGTLNVNLLNTFFPAVGDTFTFLTTGGSRTGTFALVNGLNIGGGEILNVIYGSNFIELTTTYASTTDLWNGGTGVWSNAPQWSIGVPQPAFDTIIYSGGNDLVTMDVGSSTVKSLTVGGPTNGFASQLRDNGTAQNLTITNGLSIGANGFLNLTGASTITAATMGNSGSVYLGPSATLSLTSQPTGITDAVAGSRFDLYGTFTAGGGNGFAQLNSIEGAVNLFGQSFTDTPGSTTLTISSTGSLIANSATTLTIAGNVNNSGYFDAEKGSTFQVNGNATNSGTMYTSFNGNGGNTFNVTGNLTNTNFIGLESTDTANIGGTVNNSGSFQMTGGSTATFTSALTNTGTVDLENASTLKINGTVDNSGTFSTSANGGTGGSTVTVAGLLTNQASAQLSVNGPNDKLKALGGLVNNGTVTVKNGSTIDPPNFSNLGTLNIDGTSTFVVGTGTATGPGFVQLANGKFTEVINSATAFGVVNVAGPASLNGTLDIMLQTGYNPAIGTSFTFLLLNPGQLSGTYASILNDIFNGGTEMWVVNYNNAGGSVQLTAAANNSPVPEPGTFLLLGSGLLGMAYSVRRRWLK